MITYDTLIVSLKEREDRRANVFKEFSAVGVPPVFSVWYATKDEDGRQGLIKTMREIFANRLSSDDQTPLLIFEDDMKIINPGYQKNLAKCLSQLPPDFDLMYLGCNLSGFCIRYSDNLISASGMFSSHAILYSRAAMESILPDLEGASTYDGALVEGIQQRGKCFCTYPMLVSQTDGYSDIMKKEVRYQRFLEDRFARRTAEVMGTPGQELPQSAS